MKTVLTIVGVLLVLVGAVWILQGLNLLGGSSMSGQSQWAVNGAITLIVGLGLLLYSNRKRFFRR
jgi:hypothetical protein